MKIAQCSSAHGKDSSEQKSVGCFIFPFAPSRLFIPLPPFSSLFLLPLPKRLIELSREKISDYFLQGCFREAHADRQTHACVCTRVCMHTHKTEE